MCNNNATPHLIRSTNFALNLISGANFREALRARDSASNAAFMLEAMTTNVHSDKPPTTSIRFTQTKFLSALNATDSMARSARLVLISSVNKRCVHSKAGRESMDR